jgi:hypothetical protein
MITKTDQILSRIESCLNLDKNNPTELRVQVDKIIHFLHEFQIQVPPKQYEMLVKKFLSEKVLNKAALGDKRTFPAISKALLLLASELVEKAASQEVIDIMTDKETAVEKEVREYLSKKKGI